jgi:hypothetical protein
MNWMVEWGGWVWVGCDGAGNGAIHACRWGPQIPGDRDDHDDWGSGCEGVVFHFGVGDSCVYLFVSAGLAASVARSPCSSPR